MATIKKAQNSIVKDKTSVSISKRKPDNIKSKPTYSNMPSNSNSKDSLDYKKGFDTGQERPKDKLQRLFENNAWEAGNNEGRNKPIKKLSLKSGGSVKAKDGKWMQKAAASIKKRGTEGKCTPITKPGCTGKAKALAKIFKKIAKSNKKK